MASPFDVRFARSAGTMVLASAIASIGLAIAQAETFVLKAGGRLEGELLNRDRKATDAYRVKTSDGLVVTLAREAVSKTLAKSDARAEYERRAPSTADTVAAQWELAQWCAERGLRTERVAHLERIVALDPEHEQARAALGYQRYEGEWRRPEDHQASAGYFRYKGQWRTRQEIAILQRSEAAEAEVVQWRKTIRLWRKQEGKERQGESLEAMEATHEPAALPVLCEYAADKKELPHWRLAAVEALGGYPAGTMADGVLADLALHDANEEIRTKALEKLAVRGSKTAVRIFLAALKSKDNGEVNRAGRALREMKDPTTVPALVDALVTKHTMVIKQGGGMEAGFGQDSSGNNQGSFGFGDSTKKITREVENDGVRSALATITSQAFGFDRFAWRRWLAETQLPEGANLRRGD